MRFETDSRASSRLSLTPIIDVVFLLLLFFMLASTFTRFAHVEVAVGGQSSAAAEDRQTPIVLVSVKGEGAYTVNGEAVTLDELQPTLAGAAPDGKARIVVRPSTSAQAEDIIRAIEQAQATKLGPVIMMR